MKSLHKSTRIVLASLLAFLLTGAGVASAATYVTYRYHYHIEFDLPVQPQTYGTYIYIIRYPAPAWGPVPQPAPEPVAQPTPLVPRPAAQQGVITEDEARMLQLVNEERAKVGLKPLAIDLKLVELAREKSKDMIEKGYFGHISPTYGSPFDMMKAAGISYRMAGENIAGASTVDRAHVALMNSPGHRANILNPNFTHVGIGIVDGGPYGKMFTQMFVQK